MPHLWTRIKNRPKKILILLSCISLFGLFLLFNYRYPLPLPHPEKSFATVITDHTGQPLRAFPDHQGVWRYPISIEEVSPYYLQA
ncbi:peptidoglycan glycosyltransferase PbpC, partial [Magnetococcales bacterium HHB-1]